MEKKNNLNFKNKKNNRIIRTSPPVCKLEILRYLRNSLLGSGQFTALNLLGICHILETQEYFLQSRYLNKKIPEHKRKRSKRNLFIL